MAHPYKHSADTTASIKRSKLTRAAGGHIKMTAGVESGVGRLQKARIQHVLDGGAPAKLRVDKGLRRIKKRQDGGPADESPGILEQAARFISGGRNRGQRAFYNATRAGLFNENTPPDEAYPYGGLGSSLKERRQAQMNESESIEDAVRGSK